MKRRQSTLIAVTWFGLLPIVGSPSLWAQPKAPPKGEIIAVDNARKYFLEAAALLVDEDKFGTELTAAQERDWVEANRAALSRLREGFQFRFQPLRIRDEAEGELLLAKERRGYRVMSRLLLSEGRVRQARGDLSGAFDSYLDVLQLGNEIVRDGTFISALTGPAIASLGRSGAWEALPLLDAETAKHAAQRLEAVIEKRPSFADVLRAETRFGETATRRLAQGIDHPQMTPKIVNEMVAYYRELMEWEIAAASQPYVVSGQKPQRNETAAPEDENAAGNQAARPLADMARIAVERLFDASINMLRNVRFLDTRDQTQNALLLGQLALLAHRLEYKTEADDWKLVVPAILKQAPLDPFGFDEPLRLIKRGEVFVPYSIGPDGIDNRGLPIAPNQLKTLLHGRSEPVKWDSSGDIVAGINQ